MTMLTIYFGNGPKEQDKYEQFLCAHQIKYHKRLADKMGRSQLMSLLAQTPDCFEILSPALLKYKRSGRFHFNQLLDLILVRPSRYLRLPIVIANGMVYAGVTLEDLRIFLPRDEKRRHYQELLSKE
ncbi:hypothetical protein [Streptococcus intermedius]|uniref:hypothetical protein n=2 Tax=Streptococcus intermedius TaxID=1338 RepID=UPI000F6738BE|nr:hypothetical protein [Streptococcus intermedius]